MKIEKRPDVGWRFVLAGIEYEITATLPDGVRYAGVIGGNSQILSWPKFESLLESGRLELRRTDGLAPHPSPDQLAPAETETMNRRLAYIREIERHTQHATSPATIAPIIQSVAKKIGDEKPPACSTVASWHKKYVDGRRDPMSLAPRDRSKGNRHFRFDPLVERIINRRINKDYRTRQRVHQNAVHANVVGQILDQYGKDNLALDDIAIPCERTINRRISQLDPFSTTYCREGGNQARRKFRAAGRGFLASRVLERVEADGNLMDVLIVDEETDEVIGRPYGTCLIDQYSRCILAFFVSMIPFSSATLMHALKLAISGNGDRKGGLFETLVVDNGSDYISNSVRNFCNTLGVSIEHGPPREPNSKPHVERFFGTLNSQLIHLVPGTTFSNPSHRGDYDSAKYASVTKPQLESLVWEWIDEIYHRSVTRGHGRAPEALWEEATAEVPVVTYPLESLDSFARDVIRRKINHGSVTAHYLRWYSHALATLEQYLRERGLSRQVDVYVDPLNLDRVFVRDPRNDGVLIQADCRCPEYAEGLSLFEHLKVVAELHETGKRDLAAYGTYQLEVARWRLWQKLVANGKRFAKKKIARLKEVEKRNREALEGDLKSAKESSLPIERLPGLLPDGMNSAAPLTEDLSDGADTQDEADSDEVGDASESGPYIIDEL